MNVQTTIVSVCIRHERVLFATLCDDCLRTNWRPLVEEGAVELSSAC
jgi:hypothetical protein